VELFASDSERSLWATIYSAQTAPPGFLDRFTAVLPQLESVCWSFSPHGKDVISPADTVAGAGALTYHVRDCHFRVSHHSFFQANRYLLPQMTDIALADLTGSRALDLYAGVGFFTVPLTRRCEQVTAVESHPAAARDVAANCGVAGSRVRVHAKAVESFLASASAGWDVVLVDPPRSGLPKPARERIARLRPARLVYVSCDPTTLARDAASFIAAGYRLISLHLVDQFPQTFHIEAIAHLAL
jgi:23S rRNA (uracil1939-C5)-methyltransferase